jgi:hypothetical protein
MCLDREDYVKTKAKLVSDCYEKSFFFLYFYNNPLKCALDWQKDWAKKVNCLNE